MVSTSKLLSILEKKRVYHQTQYANYSNQLIEKGSPAIRINAAMSRERVRAYDELIEIIIKS